MDAIINDPTFELLGDLSTEEFQQKLYRWLEERGTLPFLRTYLRHQLISTFKQTHPRLSLLSRKRNHLSPKVHAINLLLAEHLLEQGYHFTVSMFHSEEPRLGSFPSQDEPSIGLVSSSSYFQMKDVDDILGSLNLKTDTKLGKKVVDIYVSEKKKGVSTSLLRAIFEALGETEPLWNTGPNFSAGDAANQGNKMNKDHLLNSGVSEEPSIKPTNHSTSPKAQILGKKEKTESSHSYGENFKRQLIEWKQKEYERRMEEEVKKVKEDLEKEAASYKKKFKEDIESLQQQYEDMMNQRAQVELHLKEIQSKEEELREREASLEEMRKQEADLMASKHKDIVKSEQQLDEGFRRLASEWKNINYYKKEMEVFRNQVLGENIGPSPNLLQSHNSGKEAKGDRMGLWQQAGDNISNSNTMNVARSVSSMQQETILVFQQLKDKNEKLQMLAEEHQSKIKILTATATQQAKQLEEARAALRLLSSHDSHLSEADTKNSLEERLTVLSMMQDDKGREDFRRHKDYSESRSSRFKSFEDIPQRRHLRGSSRRHRHHDSDSDNSASSPTEEVIREARRRLQRLEKESDEVDKQFFKLRQKHLTEAGGSSGVSYSGIFPGTLQERDPTFPVYNYVPAPTNFALAPPYQLVPGSVAVKIADETSDYQQHQKQDIQVPHISMKNQDPISATTNLNASAIHPTLRQESLRTEFQMGNDPEMSASSVFNNNTQRVSSGTNVFLRESEGTALQSVKSDLSPSETPLGREHKEINLMLKSAQRQFFQSQNDFPTRDNQRNVHFATMPDKRNSSNGHIREKNHLTALSLETDKHNANGRLEERTQRKTEIGASNLMDSLSTAVELSKENINKRHNSNDPPLNSQALSQEAKALEAHVSVSSGEDSNSAKLSVGIDDLQNNSDLW